MHNIIDIINNAFRCYSRFLCSHYELIFFKKIFGGVIVEIHPIEESCFLYMKKVFESCFGQHFFAVGDI